MSFEKMRNGKWSQKWENGKWKNGKWTQKWKNGKWKMDQKWKNGKWKNGNGKNGKMENGLGNWEKWKYMVCSSQQTYYNTACACSVPVGPTQLFSTAGGCLFDAGV